MHFWTNRTEKLRAFISSLDAFTTISMIMNAAKIELSSRKDVTKNIFEKLTELRVQLHEAEVHLQQQLDNLTFERAWWQQVWQAIPAYLKPTVLSNSLKANLETVKMLIANPAELYRQSKITAEEYAMSVEIKVSCCVRTLPHYHLRALPRQQNEMRHQCTNYDEIIRGITGNNEAYMLIKRRVEVAISATQIGINEYLYEAQNVA